MLECTGFFLSFNSRKLTLIINLPAFFVRFRHLIAGQLVVGLSEHGDHFEKIAEDIGHYDLGEILGYVPPFASMQMGQPEL